MVMTRLLLLALALLAGCATAPVSTTTKVPVPIECKETVPDRPVMPTEQIAAKPTLDQWIQAAMAELLRREAYEGKLRTALEACTVPIQPTGSPR
jgi:type IV pilus biogenesis protein CpaD/CtpE